MTCLIWCCGLCSGATIVALSGAAKAGATDWQNFKSIIDKGHLGAPGWNDSYDRHESIWAPPID